MVVTLKIFTILMQTIMMITPAHSPTVSILNSAPTLTTCDDDVDEED